MSQQEREAEQEQAAAAAAAATSASTLRIVNIDPLIPVIVITPIMSLLFIWNALFDERSGRSKEETRMIPRLAFLFLFFRRWDRGSRRASTAVPAACFLALAISGWRAPVERSHTFGGAELRYRSYIVDTGVALNARYHRRYVPFPSVVSRAFAAPSRESGVFLRRFLSIPSPTPPPLFPFFPSLLTFATVHSPHLSVRGPQACFR